MSTTEYPPGWWQASDGNYYPPETHPDYQAPVVSPDVGVSPEVALVPGIGAAADGGVVGDPAVQPAKKLSPMATSIVISAMVIVFIVVCVGVFIGVKVGKSPLFPLGDKTASLTWNVTKGAAVANPQPFTGSIDGLAIVGSMTWQNPTSYAQVLKELSGGTVTIGQATGTLNGKSFNIVVTETFPKGGFQKIRAHQAQITVDATGTYGTMAFKASSFPDPYNSDKWDMKGSVGSFSFNGAYYYPTNSGSKASSTASFTVSD